MKKKVNFMGLVLVFLVLPFFTTSCKDNVDKPSNVDTNAPLITSISPDNGEPGTVITIIGS